MTDVAPPIPADRKVQDEENPLDAGDDDEEEAQRNAPAFKEHTFKFEMFEQVRSAPSFPLPLYRRADFCSQRFADEHVVKACLIYLERYRELTQEQMKMLVGLMHRQAVKAKAEGLYFQVSAINEDNAEAPCLIRFAIISRSLRSNSSIGSWTMPSPSLETCLTRISSL